MIKWVHPHHWLILLLVSCAAACTTTSVQRQSDVEPSLSHSRTVISDRLFFGRNIPGGGQVPDSAWASFVAEVITPRFPEGLTVWRAEGQWQDPHGALVDEPVMVLEVLHPSGTPPDSVFEGIAVEYCRRFHQDAVLRAAAESRTMLYRAPPR